MVREVSGIHNDYRIGYLQKGSLRTIGCINLEVKCAGKPYMGNSYVRFEVSRDGNESDEPFQGVTLPNGERTV